MTRMELRVLRETAPAGECAGPCQGHRCKACGKRWKNAMPLCRMTEKKLCHDCDEKERGAK